MHVRKLTGAQKKIVAAQQEWRCAACACVLPASYHVDHVVPLWDGGADTVDACQALCGTCHADKTQREAIDRAERRRVARPVRRWPRVCARCGCITSPYFDDHACR